MELGALILCNHLHLEWICNKVHVKETGQKYYSTLFWICNKVSENRAKYYSIWFCVVVILRSIREKQHAPMGCALSVNTGRPNEKHSHLLKPLECELTGQVQRVFLHFLVLPGSIVLQKPIIRHTLFAYHKHSGYRLPVAMQLHMWRTFMNETVWYHCQYSLEMAKDSKWNEYENI